MPRLARVGVIENYSIRAAAARYFRPRISNRYIPRRPGLRRGSLEIIRALSLVARSAAAGGMLDYRL